MYIDNNRSNGVEVAQLYDKYGIQPLVLRRREHHSCVMYTEYAGCAITARIPVNFGTTQGKS